MKRYGEVAVFAVSICKTYLVPIIDAKRVGVFRYDMITLGAPVWKQMETCEHTHVCTDTHLLLRFARHTSMCGKASTPPPLLCMYGWVGRVHM